MHEAAPSGLSYYGAHNAELRTAEALHALPIESAVAGSIDVDRLRIIRAALRELPDFEARARPAAHHPWSFVEGVRGENATTESAVAEIDEDAAVAAVIRDVATAADQFDNALDAAWAHADAHGLLLAAGGTADLRLAAAVLQGVRVGSDVLAAVRTDRWKEDVRQLQSNVGSLPAEFGDVFALTEPPVLDLDLDRIASEAAAADASGFFGRKKRRRAVLAQVSSVLRPGVEVPLAQVGAVLARIVALRDATKALTTRIASMPGVSVSSTWNPMVDSSRALIGQQADWISWLGEMSDVEHGTLVPMAFRSAAQDFLVSDHVVEPSAASRVAELADAQARLLSATGTSAASWAAWAHGRTIVEAWIATRVGRDTTGSRGVRLADWVRWRVALEPLRRSGVTGAYDLLLKGTVPAEEALDAFDRGFASASMTERAAATGLDTFDAVSHSKNIERYTTSAHAARKQLPEALAHAVAGHRSFGDRTARGRAGELVAHVAKQRGRLSVREIMTRYGDLVTEITPCVLVSPDSVARFFPAKSGLFDIVVFDEASQVRVADAIGAMGRGTSVVVVGDSKQMPPTSFAESSIGDDDDESQVAEVLARDEESILAQCKDVRIESRWLSWHYRSQDESLIAFSNRAYYDDQLTSFPSPAHDIVDEGARGHGVALRRLEGQFLRAGMNATRATLRTNPIEANAIVDEIRARFAAEPSTVPSLGVVTFNAQQRTLIESLLRDTGDERIVEALDLQDGLFVKNLENVQGDERDTILFSAAFSKNEKGILPLNFGPLTNHGGERRLNVAITRARRQVIIFASFDPGDLRTEQTASQGIRDLRAYMELAERGAGRVLGTWVSAAMADLHREDIAEELRARGLEVATDVGLSDFKVDLAVTSPAASSRGSASMAILLDGPTWASRRTVADRDALPVEVLSGLMKWPVVERIWLPEWVADRDTVVDRLVAAAHLATPAEGKPMAIPSASAAAGQWQATDERISVLAEQTGSTVPHGVPTAVIEPFDSSDIGRPSSRRRANRDFDRESGVPFTPWSTRVAGSRAVLDDLNDVDNQRAIRSVIKEVVRDEGPITEARLLRLVAGAFGLQRVHEERRRAILDMVPFRFRRADDPGVYWPADVAVDSWTGYRTAGPRPERPLEAVPLSEIANAVVAAVGGQPTDVSTVMRHALATFGGARMTPAIGERLEEGVARAVQSGRVIFVEGGRLARRENDH